MGILTAMSTLDLWLLCVFVAVVFVAGTYIRVVYPLSLMGHWKQEMSLPGLTTCGLGRIFTRRS